MKIEAITLREIHMKLKTPFEISSGVTQQRCILLVDVKSDGLSGWGEVTAGEAPNFNYETTGTAWHIISSFIVPLLLGKQVASASEVPALLGGIRGHEMAKAAVENAIWDIEAQRKGMPLFRLLGGTQNVIPCGVSLGIKPSPAALLEVIAHELKSGYQRIKLKIKPGKDLEYVAAARQEHPKILLSVDANSAYTLEDADHLKQFDSFDLLMMEQPLSWDDICNHAKLQAQMQTSICLDECIHNARQAASAIELGACRIVNVKLGRVGGHTEARRVHDVCRQQAIPVWCGGMLESGVGRAHNIAMSTLPGFTLPGDVSASQRYWEEDIIEPEVEVSPQGTIRVPTQPGLGYRVRTERIQKLTVRVESWRASA